MKRKRMLCHVLSLCLAAAALTACGDSSSQTAGGDSGMTETTTGVSGTAPQESGVSGTETTSLPAEAASQTTVQTDYIPTNDRDYDTAYLTLDSYFKACATGDSDLVKGASNLLDAYETADMHGAKGAQFEREMDEKIAQQCQIRSAKIGKGAAAETMMTEYHEALEALKQDAVAADDLDLSEELALKLDLRQQIELLYVFPVMVQTADGQSISDLYYVTCSGHEWTVDLAAIPEFVQERRAAGMQTAAANAKHFFLAVNNALNDMTDLGADVTLMDGVYYYRGADLGWGEMPEEFERANDVITAVNIRLGYYCGYLKDCDQMAYAINNGACKAVAIQCGGENEPLTDTDQYYYGCYPRILSEEDFGEYISIDDVMTHALG
ncbi:MAG: hypothetical protein IJ060_10530 [Oscillospiraceae bacterium]|nr:hypothetical protein [Oscillospiraceae bacterium]